MLFEELQHLLAYSQLGCAHWSKTVL